MKATYLLLTLGLLAGCAQPPRERAEAAASRYLKATLHDPGSYEAVLATSQPYTRQDSVAYAARIVARHRGLEADSAVAKPGAGSRDTTRVGWLVKLTYRIRNGYSPVSEEHATFVVYPPDAVVPITP